VPGDREGGTEYLPDMEEKAEPGNRLDGSAADEAESAGDTSFVGAEDAAARILREAWRAALRPTPREWDIVALLCV